MSKLFPQRTARVAAALLLSSALWAADTKTVTVMTRNMYSGTDMGLIMGATDQGSFVAAVAATLAGVKASGIAQRAAALADEIAAAKPDVIGLQEVTLWRTGPMMQPPATDILYDQLAMLQSELNKRKLSYGIAAIQSLMDAEAPVPTEGIDLRITDRDVILVRTDLPQSQFDSSNAQTRRYQTIFQFGSPLLGQLAVLRGWESVDVTVAGSAFRFVNTHLESTYPGVPDAAQLQLAQVDELIGALANVGMPVVLAGDFNANAEPGPEHTGSVEKIVAGGFAEAWRSFKPYDPAPFTWPLFPEDPAAGPSAPNERIDLIFTTGSRHYFGRDLNVLSVDLTGTTPPWASDHAGVVMKLKLK